MTFLQHREPEPEWVADLASVSPKFDTVPWLKLVWFAGQPYEPIQRWVLYEMVPNLALVDTFRMAALKGPAPKTLGEWRADGDIPQHLGGKRWHSESLVSQTQWELFHQTGCAPFLFWVIQGNAGGHKWRLSNVEKHFITTFYGHGADVPNMGDLPYAEWNGLTKAQVLRSDRIRKWSEAQSRPFTDRTANKTEAGLYVAQDTWDAEQEYAKVILKFLMDQVEDGVSNLSDQEISRLMARRGPGDTHYNADQDAVERRLIEATSHAPLPEE